MARLGQIQLLKLKRRLFGSRVDATKGNDDSGTIPLNVTHSRWRPSKIPMRTLLDVDDGLKIDLLNRRSTSFWNSRPEFPVGASVLMLYPADQVYYQGTVTAVLDDAFEKYRYNVAFDDGSFEQDVSGELLQFRKHATEGGNVEGCFDPMLEECYPGKILRVEPSGFIAIQFDDGDVEWKMVRFLSFVCICLCRITSLLAWRTLDFLSSLVGVLSSHFHLRIFCFARVRTPI